MDEQVKSVQVTRDEVQSMMNGREIRNTTPEVEPPVVEALTPPPTTEELLKKRGAAGGDEFAGLDNLDPEIVALLKAELMNKSSMESGAGNTSSGPKENEYAP